MPMNFGPSDVVVGACFRYLGETNNELIENGVYTITRVSADDDYVWLNYRMYSPILSSVRKGHVYNTNLWELVSEKERIEWEKKLIIQKNLEELIQIATRLKDLLKKEL